MKFPDIFRKCGETGKIVCFVKMFISYDYNNISRTIYEVLSAFICRL